MQRIKLMLMVAVSLGVVNVRADDDVIISCLLRAANHVDQMAQAIDRCEYAARTEKTVGNYIIKALNEKSIYTAHELAMYSDFVLCGTHPEFPDWPSWPVIKWKGGPDDDNGGRRRRSGGGGIDGDDCRNWRVLAIAAATFIVSAAAPGEAQEAIDEWTEPVMQFVDAAPPIDPISIVVESVQISSHPQPGWTIPPPTQENPNPEPVPELLVQIVLDIGAWLCPEEDDLFISPEELEAAMEATLQARAPDAMPEGMGMYIMMATP